MKVQELKSRDDYLDLLKGIGILCVVFGHFIEPFRNNPFCNAIFVCIYCFHMPLFCFCSGTVGKFNIKKLALYIVPLYVVSQLFYAVLRLVFTGHVGGIGSVVLPWWHLWYLYALIFWQLSVWALQKVNNRFIKLGFVGGYSNKPTQRICRHPIFTSTCNRVLRMV